MILIKIFHQNINIISEYYIMHYISEKLFFDKMSIICNLKNKRKKFLRIFSDIIFILCIINFLIENK